MNLFPCHPSLPSPQQSHLLRLLQLPPAEAGFSLYYQPIWQVSARRFSRCEALLRLHDASLGTVTPEYFIPLAEQAGRIAVLGQFALEEACGLLIRLEDQAIPLTLHVNLSPLQLDQPEFHPMLEQILHRTGARPELLELELTESAAAASVERLTHQMEQIRTMGVNFSLDDFGSGYSSLRYLASLPFSTVKLDKVFIQPLPQSPSYMSLVKNLIPALHELGFAVVGEGVENPAQYRILERLGCDYMQGFLLAKPMPKAELLNFLKAPHSLVFPS